jgi:NADH-ubiquinone oxidoreductase chain 2
MNPFLHLTFLSTIALGTIIVFLSSHWFFIWLGLEINTLAFLPLLISSHHPRSTEATTKYFLTQALASILLLLASLIQASWTNSWLIETPLIFPSLLIILFALAFKLAIPPCHSWLPDVLQGLPLLTGLILSTWQKLAPFYILLSIQISSLTWILLPAGVIATIVGGYGGLNQTQTRKLLAFSSIAHMGWTISILSFCPQLSILNFIIYLTITSSLFLAFQYLNSLNLTNLSNSINFSPWLTTLTLIATLSLAGLPPLTGFLGKWLIFQELSTSYNILAIAFLILGNLLSLYYYLRISYIILLTLSPQHIVTTLTWRATPLLLKNTVLTTLILISILTLPLAPLWLALTY